MVVETPTLKVSSATNKWLSGNPISLSAPAKPRPWTSPNRKATTAGQRRESVGIIIKREKIGQARG